MTSSDGSPKRVATAAFASSQKSLSGPVFLSFARNIECPRSVTSTDHVPFDAAGLPGFQFIQERLEYQARTHHSNMDTFDRIQPDDLKQQGAVAAVFAWQAANAPEKLPRKPMPAKPGSGQ